MYDNLLNIIFQWLIGAKYNISQKELRIRLFSHPDCGTISSITDTLDDFGISNQAVHVDTCVIDQLKEPFISFVKREHIEQFVLVSPTSNNNFIIFNGKDHEFNLSNKEFGKIFGGIIIAIDKQQKRITNYNQHLLSIIPYGLIISICFVLFFHIQSQLNTVLFSILSLTGFTFSALLFGHTLGVNNDFLKRFCSISKESSCNSVLQSEAARISKYINLTDVGIFYFSFQLISQLFLKYDNSLLYAMGIAASSFSFYSIHQQAFVIKKWCPLCLGVVAVLLLQGIISIINFKFTAITLAAIISSLFLILFTSIGWYYFKNIFTKSRKFHRSEIDLLSFKRNYHLFLPFYKSDNAVNDAKIRKHQPLLIGNIHAPVSITIVTNPLCKACKNAHQLLTDLQNQFPNDISIRIVFYVPYQNLNDPRTMIAGWLVDKYLNHCEEGVKTIKHWYKKPDVKAFDAIRVPIETIRKQQNILQTHAEWCMQQRLTLTPLLLINNKLFPLIYRIEDLRFHIEAIIEYEKTKEYESQKSFHSTKVLACNT